MFLMPITTKCCGKLGNGCWLMKPHTIMTCGGVDDVTATHFTCRTECHCFCSPLCFRFHVGFRALIGNPVQESQRQLVLIILIQSYFEAVQCSRFIIELYFEIICLFCQFCKVASELLKTSLDLA